jgi:mono/diheme cytochrome c family protein
MKTALWLSCLAAGLCCAWLATAQNLDYRRDDAWQAPPQAEARRNPLAGKPEAAGGGRKLFLRECAECHGQDGRGLEHKHSANFTLPAVQQQSDGSFFWKITNGNPDRGMPSFSKLPELQRWQLVLHLRTLGSRDRSATSSPR